MASPRTVVAQPATPLAAREWISVRVSVMRKPELLLSTLPEMCEEGDILFDAIGSAESTYSKHFQGVNPVLVFSNDKSIHLVGEVFRAFICFRNGASFALTKMFFRVELVTPQGQRVVMWEKEGLRMEALENYSVVVRNA